MLVTAMIPGGSATAQSALEGEGYVELDRTTEISLARSAAPATVSENASVWILDDGRYELVLEGSNDNHCLVMRSYPKSLEPLCYDAEGSRTILPLEIRRFELRNAGQSWDEIDRIIDEEITSGKLSIPKRPAMSYMMSSAQDLYAPDGRNVGNWKPHIMLYMPGATDAQFGLAQGGTPLMQFFEPGTPIAHLIVVVPDFVTP